MKSTLLFGFLFLGLIILSSCEKEEAFEAVVLSEEEKAERYVLNYQVDVLFANIKIDHQNNTLTGYLIDKRSALKYLPETAFKVLGISNLEKGVIPAIPIQSIDFRAVEQKSLNPIEIKEYLIKAYTLNDSPNVDLADENASTSYYKFNFKADQNHASGGDSSCNSGYSLSPGIAQILIQTQGQLSMSLDQKQKEISGWLDTFETTHSFLN